MIRSRRGHVAGRRELARGGVVEFCAGQWLEAVPLASSDQDFSIGEQGR